MAMTEDPTKLFPLVAQVSAVYEAISVEIQEPIAKAGLTDSMFQLLSTIKAGGGEATQARVAEALGITPASLSEAVRDAEAQGLVIRKQQDGDKRVKMLDLTDQGQSALRVCFRGLEAVEAKATKGLSADDLRQAQSTLRKALANLIREG